MARDPEQGRGPGKKARKPGLDAPEDGAALWRKVTETVTPLKTRRNRKPPVTAPDIAVETDRPKKRTRKFPAQPTTSAPSVAPAPKSKELTHGLAPDLDKRTNLRLIRGKMPVEGTLDLHGHTKEAAHSELNSFIKRAFSDGKRCVIVITGKGLRLSTGEVGVLRQAVPQWLNSATLRPMVLAYSHATPKDGGEGALYVLLKRKR